MVDYSDQVERGELHQTYRDLPEMPYRSGPSRGGSFRGPGLRGCSVLGCLFFLIAGFLLHKLTLEAVRDSPFSESGDAYFRYHPDSKPPIYEVLKFYDDGLVVATALADIGEGRESWRQKAEQLGRDSGKQGHYRISAGTITFSIFTPRGAIDYSGELVDGNLILDIHSHVEGYRASGQIYQPLDPRLDPSNP